MSSVNLLNLIIFLWLVGIFIILRIFQAIHPYREGSPEQKAEDRVQALTLRIGALRAEAKRKAKKKAL